MADKIITPAAGSTTIVERRGGGAGWLIGIVLLIAVAVGAWYLLGRKGAQNSRDSAITSAAHSVGDAADRVGGGKAN